MRYFQNAHEINLDKVDSILPSDIKLDFALIDVERM
jgi:hypothetical protein